MLLVLILVDEYCFKTLSPINSKKVIRGGVDKCEWSLISGRDSALCLFLHSGLSVFLACTFMSNCQTIIGSLYSFVHLVMQIHGCAGSQSVPAPVLTPSERDGVPNISLPVFGLASYKFKPSSWIPNEGGARQLLNSLLQDAENWLSSLQVNHPDFLFFRRR